MNWRINTLTYLNSEIILKIFFSNKDLFKKIAEIIIQTYYFTQNRKLIFNNIFLDFVGIYPRILNLKTTHLDETNEVTPINSNDNNNIINRYIFNGKGYSSFQQSDFQMIETEFIYSNYVIPHPNNSLIPFTIGFSKDNNFKLVNSNLFYFEVFIDTYFFRKPFDKEVLQVGFTDVYDDPKNIIFGDGSFGIDCINSFFKYNKKEVFVPQMFFKGDTIGLGLEYIDKFKYKPFITYNGKLITLLEDVIIETESQLKIILNLKLSTGIDVNFGQKNFIFDIESINNCNSIINSTKNNLINNGYNLKKIDTDYLISDKNTE